MFCPQCKYEYREGFYVCSDCNVDLVDKLEEKLPELIKPSLDEYKAALKRLWISLAIAAGLFAMLLFHRAISHTYDALYKTISDTYYELSDYHPPLDYEVHYHELLEKLSRLNIWIEFIIISCISSLLIYTAYKGFRYIRPFGGVFLFAGLSVIATLALMASGYTIIYISYFWPDLMLELLNVFGL